MVVLVAVLNFNLIKFDTRTKTFQRKLLQIVIQFKINAIKAYICCVFETFPPYLLI